MPSVTYMNQSAPFWDFIASLEQQGRDHPMFAETNNNNTNEENRGEGHESHREEPSFDPFGWGNFFGGQAFAHRGPPPPGPPPAHHEEDFNEKEGEKGREQNDETMRDDKENDNGEGPSCNSGSDNEGRAGGRGRHGRCGGRREGRCGRGGPGGWGGPWGWGGRHGGPPHHRGPWGGPWGEGRGPGPHHHHGGPGHHHGGPRGFGRRGGWGPRGSHPFAAAFDPSALVAHFWEQFQDKPAADNNNENTDHTPDADIFDTETAYVIHVSLPGAKKEDVGVNWDAEKSELSIAGVIYRPGDEEFLKTLAMNERKVGPFERKVRLGTRATPAHVDIDAITAKLEDGILRVEVPKLDAGYVEVRKVDIE